MDGITNHVRDPLVKAALRKIPPSCHNLFNAESFTSALEKAGGVRRCFWPVHKRNTASSGIASQAISNKANCCPSQGKKQHPVPSQGTSGSHPKVSSMHTSFCNPLPSQGECNHSYPSQGRNSRHAAASTNKDSFRGRQSQPNQKPQQQYGGNRKRASSSSGYRGNKRRKY